MAGPIGQPKLTVFGNPFLSCLVSRLACGVRLGAFVSPDKTSAQFLSFHTEILPSIRSYCLAFMLWFTPACIDVLVLPRHHCLHNTSFKSGCCLESPLFLELRLFQQLPASESYWRHVRGSHTQCWYLIRNKEAASR